MTEIVKIVNNLSFFYTHYPPLPRKILITYLIALKPKCNIISATITTPKNINKSFKGKNISIKLKAEEKASIFSLKAEEKSERESPEKLSGNLPIVLFKNQVTMFIKKSKIDIKLLKKMLNVCYTPKYKPKRNH